jgi:acyl-CoA thioester hydrolase
MTMAGGDAENLGIEVWRGGVNTWECDENGHMNVRFYIARVMEGMVGLAAALGMPKAYAPGAGATLLLREHHIRFLREARPPGLLHMRAGVISIDETEARVLLVLYHTLTGQPAASFVSRIGHVTSVDARAFPWPRQTRERAERLTVEIPSYAAARSIDLAPVESQASLERAKALGLTPIGMGAIGIGDCDPFGRMRAEQLIGRISDGVPQLVAQFREIMASSNPTPPKRPGGAVLEYRLVYLELPRAGDRVAIYSGLAGVNSRTQHLVHWMLDPESGRPLGVGLGVAAPLDLDTRKMVPISPEAIERLGPFTIPGLTL